MCDTIDGCRQAAGPEPPTALGKNDDRLTNDKQATKQTEDIAIA